MVDQKSRALTVEEALSRILDGVVPLGVATVPIDEAYGRILATDITARLSQPPFAASAMDGYAVRSADVVRLPAELTVIGESAAGARFRGTVGAMEAVRILTGAPVPAGSDGVVIQENTARDGARLLVREGTPVSGHIRPAGGDFRKGQTLLAAGHLLDARALSLAAAAGYGALPVRNRPRVAILATGDELVPPGVEPGPDQIVSSNPVGIAGLVRAFGGEPVLLGIAPDSEAAIAARIAAADDADIVVTTGGASVGDHDLVRPALVGLGMTLEFWQLAMRPGKPMLFGRLGTHQRVLGLPGNPVASLITARIFLVPLLAALLGQKRDESHSTAVLTTGMEANGPRQHYMRARLEMRAGDRAVVTALVNQDSSLLSLLVGSNALIVRPPHAAALPAGAMVPVLPIDY